MMICELAAILSGCLFGSAALAWWRARALLREADRVYDEAIILARDAGIAFEP